MPFRLSPSFKNVAAVFVILLSPSYILKFQIFVSLYNSLLSFIINHLAKFCVSFKFFSNEITFTSALLMDVLGSRELTISFFTLKHKKLRNLDVNDDSSLIFLEGYNFIL